VIAARERGLEFLLTQNSHQCDKHKRIFIPRALEKNIYTQYNMLHEILEFLLSANVENEASSDISVMDLSKNVLQEL
jgi:hypothetical protein